MGLKLGDLIKAAQRQGWRVEETKMGYRFLPPDTTKGSVLAHRDAPEYALKKTLCGNGTSAGRPRSKGTRADDERLARHRRVRR